jgi:hypothetical protein
MKTIIFTLSVLSLLSLQTVLAQDWDESTYVSPLKKGDALLTVNVGYPNWGKYLLTREFNDFDVTNGVTRGFAPLGISGEFMISKDVSLTLSGFVNRYGGTWRSTKEVYVLDQFVNETHDYEFDLTRYRVLVGMQYNISDLEIDNFLFHVGAAVGANEIRFSESSSNPNWRLRDQNYFAIENEDMELPIAFRLNVGFRYFFKNNLVFNFDAALGGPSLSLGLGYKF